MGGRGGGGGVGGGGGGENQLWKAIGAFRLWVELDCDVGCGLQRNGIYRIKCASCDEHELMVTNMDADASTPRPAGKRGGFGSGFFFYVYFSGSNITCFVLGRMTCL